MKTITPAILVCVLGAFLLGGCASVNTVEAANPTGQKQMIADKRVITDSSLNGVAEVLGVNTSMAGDLLQVQAEVRNRTRGVKNVSYQVEWYDKEGMLVRSPSQTWHVLSLEGGEHKMIKAVAPNPDAVDFRIKMLESVRMSGTVL